MLFFLGGAGGVRKALKKCHVLFEWPLITNHGYNEHFFPVQQKKVRYNRVRLYMKIWHQYSVQNYIRMMLH
jgi:hypothetical protein